MKTKSLVILFSLILLFSIFNMGFIPAFSPLKFVCSDGQVYDYIHESGGCSTLDTIEDFGEPPTFFGGFSHKLKFAVSSPETKVKLLAVLTDKQIAQLELTLAEGDYKKAEAVSENIRKTLEKSGRWLEEFSGEEVNYNEFQKGEGEFNDFLYTKNMYVQNIEHLNGIKGEILKSVDAGETTHVAVDGIFDALNNEGEVIAKIEEKENEFVDKVAEEGEVTELEIKYTIYEYDKESGITENYYQNYDAQDYAGTMARLDSLRTEIANSDLVYSREVENLFDEAQLRAQLSQSEIQNEHYSDGYNEFYKSQYIMYNLENYVEEGERALNKIDETIVVGPAELNKEIEEENKKFVEEYASARDTIIEKYPEEVANLDNSYIVAQDVVALSEKINEVAEQELTKLEEAGKTEEEAEEIIEEKKVEEHYYNLGGRYFPPQYVSVSTDEETREIDYEYGGGFVKRYDYSDEAGDTNYIFGDDGYSWITSLTGEKYSAPHPTDYEPERVKRGDEVFRTEVKTEDGNYNYEYYATGYKTTAPDGTETEVVYSDTADKMQFTGGAFVDYEPTGYVVTYKGDSQVWQGNPAFDNYINLEDGKVFVPEVSPQEDATYKTEEKIYEDTYEGVKWTFDPATKIWTNDATKQTVPTTAPDAPIGYEEEAKYTTEDGTEWTYEENAEKFAWHWKGVDGIEGDYIPAPNNYYSYDDETGNYIDVRGNSYVGAIDYRGEKWTMQGGAWVSEGKTTYDPKTGKTYIQYGDAIEEVGADYRNYGRMYDASGKETRSYNYNTGSYAWDPRTNSYGYYSEYGLANYDPANPTKHELKDAQGNIVTTWVQDKDGRWRVEGSAGDTGYFGYEKYSNLAEIGTNVVGDDGKKYYVDSKLGWTTVDENGNSYAVAPPMVGGKQQPSSAMRTGMPGGNYATGGYPGYYGGYYDSATGSYVGATGCSGGCYGDYGYGTSYYGGSYAGGGGYDASGNYVGGSYGNYDASGNYMPSGSYSAPGTSGYPTAGTTGYYTSGYLPSTGVTGRYDSSYITAMGGSTGYFDKTTGAWVAPSTTNYASYYGGYAGGGAEVGRTTVYNGQTYTVTAEKGWTDASGNAVAPPPGQPSSAAGSYSGSGYTGGYYSTSGTWVPSGGYVAPSYDSATGTYTSSGYYDSTGTYVPSTGTYSTTGPNAWTASGTSSGAYTGGWNYDSATGTYTPSGGYTVGAGTYDSATGTYSYGSNTYSGGTYDSSTGSYTVSGSGSYSGGSYSGGTGTYSGSGSYSGGDTSTSSSTSTSTSSGGDSGGTTSSGGDSGGSTGGESAPTGGVISEPESNLKDGWFRSFWKSLFR